MSVPTNAQVALQAAVTFYANDNSTTSRVISTAEKFKEWLDNNS